MPKLMRIRSGTVVHEGGTAIRYWTAGDIQAPRVVCTHGVTLDHGTFASQVPVLCAAGYRVVVWDLNGHGSSQPMRRSFTFRTAADELGVLLDEEGADRVVLVGQSFGGFVAQEFCRRSPNRVSALVLVGTPALGHRPALRYLALQRIRPFALRLWPEGHLRRMLPSFMSARPKVQRYVAQATHPLSKAALIKVTAAALEALSHHDPTLRLALPVLLTHGQRENNMIARMIAAWDARDPRAQCEVIPNAGHLANQDNSMTFNHALLGFLRQHEPP